MDGDLVLLERRGAVALLTIHRPKALNALDRQVLTVLAQRLDEVAADRSVRAVVLTGAGDKSFVAGADIGEMAQLTPEQALAFALAGQAILSKIEQMPKPVIAAVNGYALGGGTELALACDVILASTRAKFGLPEVTLGVIPGFGGTQRLARLIGRNAARRWVLSGDVFPAEEALRLGVAHELHAPETLLDAAVALADRMGQRGPVAVAQAKGAIVRGEDLPLNEALELEAAAFAQCFRSSDQREGMTAFLEKRPAKFTGE